MALREGQQVDTLPSQLYGKKADGTIVALMVDDDGNIILTPEMSIPAHYKLVIDQSLAPATTVLTYSKGGVTVATKTISVSGTTTTIEVT